MLHKISLVFVLALLVVSSGCMKVKKKDESETEKATQVEQAVESQHASESKFDFDYEIEDGLQNLRFQFPNDWPEVVVVEKTAMNEKSMLREINMSKRIWKDSLVSHAKTSYRFFEKTDKDLKLLEQLDVIPSVDYVVDNEVNLEELYGSLSQVRKIQIQNLELKTGAKIFLGDFKGVLLVDRLLSNQGSIQTFADGTRAKNGNGRNVGEFKLKILDGEGTLRIFLNGEDGANGENGKAPDISLKGADGIDGSPAVFTHTRTSDCNVGLVQVCIIPARIFDCTAEPKAGGNAKNGHQGFSGYPGGNGGSVMPIVLQNLNPKLSVEVLKRAGKGGAGGFGGQGGDPGNPGIGGDGAERDFKKFLNIDPTDPTSVARSLGMVMGNTCKAAVNGRPGSQGNQGDPGLSGKDGTVF